MTVLADHISVHGRFARSANLERDADRSHPFEGYVVTARALDAVERIFAAAATGPAGGGMVTHRTLRLGQVLARLAA